MKIPNNEYTHVCGFSWLWLFGMEFKGDIPNVQDIYHVILLLFSASPASFHSHICTFGWVPEYCGLVRLVKLIKWYHMNEFGFDGEFRSQRRSSLTCRLARTRTALGEQAEKKIREEKSREKFDFMATIKDRGSKLFYVKWAKLRGKQFLRTKFRKFPSPCVLSESVNTKNQANRKKILTIRCGGAFMLCLRRASTFRTHPRTSMLWHGVRCHGEGAIMNLIERLNAFEN